jgi:thioredoxin 1
MALAVTEQSFKNEVLDFDGVVLVDFWAEWCGPYKAISPVIEKLAEDYSSNNKVKIVKLDVDTNSGIQSQYQVFSIPTLKIFKNGEVAESLVGLRGEADIKAAIDALL